MRFLNIIVNLLALQLVFGLIVTKKVSGGPIHISGVVRDHSSLNGSHISGAVLPDVKTPSSGVHVIKPETETTIPSGALSKV